jgi:hypothetical protein
MNPEKHDKTEGQGADMTDESTPLNGELMDEFTPESGLLEDPHHTRGDLQLAGRAARLGWPVPNKLKQKVMDACDRILDSGKACIGEDCDGGGTREVLGAGNLVVKADTLNQKYHAMDQAERIAEKESKNAHLHVHVDANGNPVSQVVQFMIPDNGRGDPVESGDSGE